MDIKDTEFQKEVMETSMKKPVLVDFWSPTCPPCLALKPVLEKLEEEYKEKVKIVKINVAENTQNAVVYGVRSVPAVKLFKEGKVVDEFIGYIPEQDVKDWLDERTK